VKKLPTSTCHGFCCDASSSSPHCLSGLCTHLISWFSINCWVYVDIQRSFHDEFASYTELKLKWWHADWVKDHLVALWALTQMRWSTLFHRTQQLNIRHILYITYGYSWRQPWGCWTLHMEVHPQSVVASHP
jgi:hypothetical protein